MNRSWLALTTLATFALAAMSSSFAAVQVGEAAPAFTATDASGKTVSLADFKGRHVVLEWVNPGCPFVVKHYGSGNMQSTQKTANDKGVVWLAINSTNKDHGDYRAPESMQGWMQGHKAVANATLMDSDGKVGRAYGARTTPHMYVIDPSGKLVYAGAIDSKPSANPADITSATNHVKAALAETLAGKAVSVASTKPYGCSVKYASAM
jgi:peroxiredoxin